MEDAMIMNKGAYERGFGHGCVYKNYIHPLNEVSGASSHGTKSRFRMFQPKRAEEMQQQVGIDLAEKGLDTDGLPFLGKKLE